MVSMPISIPILDLSLARSSATLPKLVRQLDEACKTSGFFYIVNHGVPKPLIAKVFSLTAQFFALSDEQKMAMHLSRSTCRRGYERIGDQTLDENALPDQKESFYCGIEYPNDHPYVLKSYDTYGVSQWPSQVPLFQSTMGEYIATQLKICHEIMGLVALAFDLKQDYFEPTLQDPMVTLRLLRYPPHPQNADARLFGAGAHTDWGAVTVLAQDEQGGLEVQLPSGQWVSAPPVADSFVVNLGDMMPRWTNDIYRSNLHRVVNASKSGLPRYSIPFFFEPNFEAPIEPIPGTVSNDKPRRYGPCTAGEHLRHMVEKTYGGKVIVG
jgi:isopenicillin N synthase-like dioxygenase